MFFVVEELINEILMKIHCFAGKYRWFEQCSSRSITTKATYEESDIKGFTISVRNRKRSM